MDFVLLFVDRKPAPAGEPAGSDALAKLAAELARDGKLHRAAPLAPEAEAARVRVRGGRATVTDGPFAESKEEVVGLWIFEAATREEALEVARRAYEIGEPRPHARHGVVELHVAGTRRVFPASDRGRLFLLAFRMEEGLVPDGAKMDEMIAFGRGLVAQGTLLETAPLTRNPPHARIESRDGKTVVLDGPFTETKEVVGGYSLVRAASRAEAIELAIRYPHAKWGPVEVRETIERG